jgi:hypothetical protein
MGFDGGLRFLVADFQYVVPLTHDVKTRLLEDFEEETLKTHCGSDMPLFDTTYPGSFAFL